MSPRTPDHHQKLLISLPAPLAAEVNRYAQALRQGNKSRFVRDALQAHIARLRRADYTARLRQSYAASAGLSRQVSDTWQPVDTDTWPADHSA